MHSPNLKRHAWGFAAAALMVTGCTADPIASLPPATEAPSAPIAESSPPVSAGPPAGRVVTVDQVMFSDDMQRARLEFIGGSEWTAEAPDCAVEYAGWAAIVDDTLEVAAIEMEVREGGSTPSGEAVMCTAVGFQREVTVELPEPFHGSHVRNVGGPAFPLLPVAAAALWEIPDAALPEGWALRPTVRLFDASQVGVTERVYAPSDFPDLEDPQIRLIQYFDPAAGQGLLGFGTVTEVDVGGDPAHLVESTDGGLVLSWKALSVQPLALTSNKRTVSGDELVAIANSVRSP